MGASQPAAARRFEELPTFKLHTVLVVQIWQLWAAWLAQLKAAITTGIAAGIGGIAVFLGTTYLLHIPNRSWWDASNVPEGLASGIAAVAWFFICLMGVAVWAAFTASTRVAREGIWQGNRFVFHAPPILAAFLAMPADNKRRFIVRAPQAEKFSVVHLVIENPSGSHLLRAIAQSPFFTLDDWENPLRSKLWPTFADGPLEAAIRIGKQRQFYIEWVLPSNALPHELRVKMTSFEIQDHTETEKFKFFHWRISQPKNGFDVYG